MYRKGAKVYIYLLLAIGLTLISTLVFLAIYSFNQQTPIPDKPNKTSNQQPLVPSTNISSPVHLACVNRTCVPVDGPGGNTCLAIGMSCGTIGGGGGGGGGSGGGGTGGGTSLPSTQCQDGIDNDNDGATDLNDFSCINPEDNDESSPKSECQDGIDNDNDGKIDYGLLFSNDPQCSSNQDNSESNEWIRLNGGQPIDTGKNIYPGKNQLIHDSSNNLLYFFREDVSLTAGRFNAISKKWEILTFSGWSSQNDFLPMPVGESKWLITKLRLFKDPIQPSRFVGTMSGHPFWSRFPFDVHGAAYGITLDTSGIKAWSSDRGYSITNGQALGYSHIWNSYDKNDFDLSSVVGLELGQINGADGADTLSASRYDVASQNWQTWVDGRWLSPPITEGNSEHLGLPITPSGAISFSPIVRAIPGKSDFIITYVSTSDWSLDGKLRAAKYSDATQTWSYWNNGWVTSGPPQNLAQVPARSVTFDRTSFFVGSKLFMFYMTNPLYSTDPAPLVMGTYDDANLTWSFSEVMPAVTDYVVNVDTNNTIWLAYRNDSIIYLRKYANGSWLPEEVISSQASSLYLIGIDFVENHPVLLVHESPDNYLGRLYALSTPDSYWQNQQIRSPIAPVSPSLLLTSNYGTVNATFDSGIVMTINSGGQTYHPSSFYGTHPCAHMSIDSEGSLYCPKGSVADVVIIPKGYREPTGNEPETAHEWGDYWDYFYFPLGSAVDNVRGKVYISDEIIGAGQGNVVPKGRIQIWDKSLNGTDVSWWFLLQNGTLVSIPPSYLPGIIPSVQGSPFNWPADMAMDEGRGILYVSESLNNRILKFDVVHLQGGLPTYIGSIGSAGQGNGQFSFPQGIDIDRDGSIYVADTNNHRIQKFDASGRFITSWGSLGKNTEEFIYPSHIAVDKENGYVYISESENRRVQIFAPDGTFVYAFNNWTVGNIHHSIVNAYGIAVQNNTFYLSARILLEDPSLEEPTSAVKITAFNMTLGPPRLQLSPEAPTISLVLLVVIIILLGLIIGIFVHHYLSSRKYEP